MATSIQVVFDCADPDKLAEFWAVALGYKLEEPPTGFATWPDYLKSLQIPEDEWGGASIEDPEGKGPRIYFQLVPEGKIVKNRLHLDLNTGGGRGNPLEVRKSRIEAEAARLIGFGAKIIRVGEEYDGFWIVMGDPEGNEFCLH